MMVYAGLVQAATFAVFAVFLWFGAHQVISRARSPSASS